MITNDNFIIEFFDLIKEIVEKRNCNLSENLKVYEVLVFYCMLCIFNIFLEGCIFFLNSGVLFYYMYM